MARNKLMLVDGNSLLLRAFYATAHGGEPLKQAPDGQYINGVDTFFRMLFKLMDGYAPTHMAVAWDLGRENTWRRKKYPEYKNHRQEKPAELKGQQELAADILDKIGICNFGIPEYEADDILGTLSKTFEDQGGVWTYIVTSDGDAMQLLADRTCVIKPVKGGLEAYTKQRLMDESGIEPWQIPHVKALMGDTSDNIPGVSGVGDKSAVQLISEYGTVEDLYDRLDEVRQDKALKRYVSKLEAGKDSAFLSKELATIVRDIPDVTAIKEIDCLYVDIRKDRAAQILTELNMESLARRFVS